MASPQYRPYELLNVDIGVTVHVQPKSVLEVVKQSYKRSRKVNMLDNPLLSHSPALKYVKMITSITEYRRFYNISVVGLEMLFYIYSLYVSGNTGVTIYGLSKVFNKYVKVSSEMNNTRKKIRVLQSKGLLVNVGKTVNNADLYIPSVKAIEDIENIFK